MSLFCTACNGEISANSWRYSNRLLRVCNLCPYWDVHPHCTLLPANPGCIFNGLHRLNVVKDVRGLCCSRCGELGFSWFYHCSHCEVDIHLDCMDDVQEDEDNCSGAY